MINKLAEINCSNISIVGTLYDYEYPLWILFKNKSSNKKIQLNHINVQNISAILQKTHITKNSCAVFHFTANNLGPSLNLKNTEEFRGKFKNEIKLNGISLYY